MQGLKDSLVRFTASPKTVITTVGRTLRMATSVGDGGVVACFSISDPICLVYTDPDGKSTHVFSIPVAFGHRHMFIAVKKADGTITTRSLYPESQVKAAIDAATGGVQNSVIHKDKANELEIARKYLSDEKRIESVSEKIKSWLEDSKFEADIRIPDGMTEEQFDNKVLESADSYPVDSRPYNALDVPNSNTYVDDVIESSGGKVPDVPHAT
jgi:hypothetical protein